MIVGLDLSLTATGIATPKHVGVLTSRRRGMERLDDLRSHIISHVNTGDIVIIEGYSYASHNQAHQLGELGGVIRHMLWDHGIAYIDVPPATLKKFATGKGSANKSAMGLAAARAGYDGPGDDNAIDAWWLRQLGEYANADEGHSLTTAYRDECVSKLEWPTVEGVAR